jgi:hypothetical protein
MAILAQRVATYYPERINVRIPDLQYHSDVDAAGYTEVLIPAPIALDADGILAAQSIATAGSTTTFAGTYLPDAESTMSRYGRNLTVVASGAATSNVTIHGRDYLNQPMSESFTLNGTSPVVGVKCFKWVDRVVFASTGGTTINVGWGDSLGLPFKTFTMQSELVSRAVPTAGALTIVAEGTTQTATTGDPRGRYIPQASFVANGSRYYELILRVDKDNLHGPAHFFSG